MKQKIKVLTLSILCTVCAIGAEIDFGSLPKRAFWVSKGAEMQVTGQPPAVRLTWNPATRKFAEWSFTRPQKLKELKKLTVTVKYKIAKGSLHTATIRLRDAKGEIFQFQQSLKTGMDTMTFKVDMEKFRFNGSWAENKKAVADKKLDFPAAFTGMSIHYPAKSAPGEMIIESIKIETDPADAAPVPAVQKNSANGTSLPLKHVSWSKKGAEWIGTLPADTPAFPRLNSGAFCLQFTENNRVTADAVTLVFSSRKLTFKLNAEKDGSFHIPYGMSDAAASLKQIIVRSSAQTAPALNALYWEKLPLAIKPDFGPASPVNVWQKGFSGNFHFTNTLPLKVSGKGLLQLRSYPDGKVLASRELKLDLPPKGILTETLPAPERYGLYSICGFLPGKELKMIPFSRRIAYLPAQAPQAHDEMQYGMMIMTWPLPVMERAGIAAAALGTDFVRSTILWSEVEPRQGRWNWKYPDGYINILTKNKLRWAPMLWYPPAWAKAKDWKPSYTPVMKRLGFPRPDYTAWEEYVRQAVRRYGSRIRLVEIWNEPELPTFANFSPEEYAELLKRAAQTVRKEKPAVKVSTCGYTCLPGQHPRMTFPDFMPRSLKAANGFYDITSIHGHGFFPDYSDMIEGFLKLRNTLGVTVPWAANETAVTSSWCSRQVQAEVLFQKMIFSHARGAVAYVWHNLRDLGRNPLNKEHNFGLLDNAFEPKEAFLAYHTAVNLFRGAAFRRDLSKNGAYCYLFENKDHFLAAGWTFQPPAAEKLLFFRNISGKVYSVDLCGNRTPVNAVNGKVLFKLTSTPSTLLFEQKTAPEFGGEFLLNSQTGEFQIAEPQNVRSVQAAFGTAKPLPRPLRQGRFTIEEMKQKMPKVTPVNIQLKTVWGDTEIRHYAISRLTLAGNDDFKREADFIMDNDITYCSTSPNDPAYADCFFKGAEDSSVKTWLGMKNDKVVLALTVRDDIHFQNKKGTQIYIGDCLQVLFSRTATKGRWKFGFALGNDGKIQTYCWNNPRNKNGKAVLTQIRTSITRSEKNKETLYRIGFPAKELGIAPGVPFRFNIQLNDNDGRCRVGYHSITEIRDDGKNDTGYPEITFAK